MALQKFEGTFIRVRTKNLLLTHLCALTRLQIIEELKVEKEKFDEAFPVDYERHDQYYLAADIKVEAGNVFSLTEFALIEEIQRLRQPRAPKFPKP